LRADPSTLPFAGKAKVLKELVLHHAEEEEKEMFKNARKAISAGELREIGERMQARKHEIEGGRVWERSAGRSAAE
jgi:hemerythrin-like domain-containing protein